MKNLIIVSNKKDWPESSEAYTTHDTATKIIESEPLEHVQIVEAKDYLGDSIFQKNKRLRVFNICRSYQYLSYGYYVSLLAEARGHRAIPSVSTILDLRTKSVIKIVSDELSDHVQRNFSHLSSDTFDLSIYFGRNLSQKYDRLARILFETFKCPLLRANFERRNGGQWTLKRIKAIPFGEIPESHRSFVVESARSYFARKRPNRKKGQTFKYDLAILVNPDEKLPPSDPIAINKFVRAGEKLSISVDIIHPTDIGKIPTYDALFIRETTGVDHRTYQFSRRAQAEGLIVIDDPDAILKCGNKVYLDEILKRNRIPHPKSFVVNKHNIHQAADEIGFPAVVKLPHSSFSQGVLKVAVASEFQNVMTRMLKQSDLIIMQEYVPTAFDWRVGFIDNKPLYVIKYFMAFQHWQIVKGDLNSSRGPRHGKTEAIPLDQAPEGLLKSAGDAANLIGDGLYGVDIKEINGKFLVVEVNDNPNIEAQYEDKVLQEKLYETIMLSFLTRLENKRK